MARKVRKERIESRPNKIEEMSTIIFLTKRVTRTWMIKINKRLIENMLFGKIDEDLGERDHQRDHKFNFLEPNLETYDAERRFL